MIAAILGAVLAVLIGVFVAGTDIAEHRSAALYEQIARDDMQHIEDALRAAFAQQINARTRASYAGAAAPQYLPATARDLQRTLSTLSASGAATLDPNGVPYVIRIYGTNTLATLTAGGATIYMPDLTRDATTGTFTNLPVAAIYAAGPNRTADVGTITDPASGRTIPDMDAAVLALVAGGAMPNVGDDLIRIVHFDDLAMHGVTDSRIRIARVISGLGGYFNRQAAVDPYGVGSYPPTLDAFVTWTGAAEAGAIAAGSPSLSGSTVDGFGLALSYSATITAPTGGGAWKIIVDTVWGGRYGL